MTRREQAWTRRTFARQLAVLAATGVALACAAPTQARDGSPAADDGGQTTELLVINPVAPRRDFVGPQPTHFAWGAVAGVDAYAIGLWNDIDLLMWRADELTTTTVDSPATLRLDPGTYFWAVTGLQQGRQIANSGRTAFVVE